MILIFFRTVLVYVIIIFSMRFMGKKQLGELQPFELVSTILISNLISIPIESPESPFLTSLFPVFLIVCIEIFLSALCVRHHKLFQLVSGRPKIIMQNGKIHLNTLKELRFSTEDLLAALRGKDVFDLQQVDLALVETNGSVSLYQSGGGQSAAAGSSQKPPSLPVILDGTVCREYQKACGMREDALEKLLREKKLKPEEILLLLYSSNGSYSIYTKEGTVLCSE